MTHIQRTHHARLTLLTLILLLAPLLAVVRPQPAGAADVVSQCTEAALRAALEGGGLVTFSCSGTIPIASQMELTQDTIIDGGGVVTLDGGGTTRLLVVNAGASLTVRGLTLTSGFAAPNPAQEGGGAILNFGSVTVESSTLSGNRADWGGAIDNFGSLTVTASSVTDNQSIVDGGALYINPGATASFIASRLSGNRAGRDGGAILNATNGVLTVVASTLSGNTASRLGGAINNQGGATTVLASTLAGNSADFGGAIYSSGGELSIVASTLSGNTASSFGGAIRNISGATTVLASTLAGNTAGNGGAIAHGGGTVTLTANLFDDSAPNDCVGSVASTGYNVASDATCNLTATGDLQNVNPLLGTLANNGGPTMTMLPQPGSSAIDRVPNTVCVTVAVATDGRDQRGAPRPESAGLSCDSGSVELQLNTFFCVGERSGAMRYVSVPNGCVRGEYRLMQSGDGQYAFCVGDRSGSMRYLPSSGTNCQRGEWKLTLPQDGPITICVGERSRAVRYVADAGQCNLRGELAYVIINPAG